jgi:hypothetical protein
MHYIKHVIVCYGANGYVDAGVGGVVGQQVTQQQEALWRVLAGGIPTG